MKPNKAKLENQRSASSNAKFAIIAILLLISFLMIVFLRGYGCILDFVLCHVLSKKTDIFPFFGERAWKFSFYGQIVVPLAAAIIALSFLIHIKDSSMLLAFASMPITKLPIDRIVIEQSGIVSKIPSTTLITAAMKKLGAVEFYLSIYPVVFVSVLAGLAWFALALPLSFCIKDRSSVSKLDISSIGINQLFQPNWLFWGLLLFALCLMQVEFLSVPMWWAGRDWYAPYVLPNIMLLLLICCAPLFS
jgi:hypothetical protein